jgi:putative ABC transport system permease protein
MRIRDIISISQNNLFRSKLRTALTIAAVFIGALTLSLTNGVGNGIKSYVNNQLGNLGVEHTLIVQAKQSQFNPVATEVKKYDPNKQTGNFNLVLLGQFDIDTIKSFPGVLRITPEYNVQLEYVGTGDTKYEAIAQQYFEGLNLEMLAGRTVDPNSTTEITVPSRYIRPGTEQAALGKYVVIGFKDATGAIIEKPLQLVGVQQQSLLGNSGVSISAKLAEEIFRQQTKGIPSLANRYVAVAAQYDPNLLDDQVTILKQDLDRAGYTAQTLEDRIGIIATVINGILVVLNVFGAITLLAAAFGIINTLLMSVNERTSEIGLMKALGANRRSIFSIFAMEAASIGFWGALLGVVVSVVLGRIVSQIATESFLKDFVGFELLVFPVLPSLAVLFASGVYCWRITITKSQQVGPNQSLAL